MGWTTLSEEGTCALSGRNLQALDVTSEALKCFFFFDSEIGKFRGWDWMDIYIYILYTCVDLIYTEYLIFSRYISKQKERIRNKTDRHGDCGIYIKL